MSRGREFDEEEAVRRAMRLFWRRGYEAATLPELLDAMHLSRGSFYNAFGTKRQVLIKAIQQYMAAGMDGILLPLRQVGASRDAIEETFSRMLAYCASSRGRQGCLLSNCSTESAMRDAVIRKALTQARGTIEQDFTRALERGQAEGTVSDREPPQALAHFLLNTLSGLMLACKTRQDPLILQGIVRLALRSLD